MMTSRKFARWRSISLISAACTLVLVPLAPKAAQAQGAPAVTEKVEDARQHYDRGLRLYDDGAYDGARVEFERAYEIAPSYRILYNIGLVHKQQSDFVGALGFFELYLNEGGAQVPQLRRNEIQKELSELRTRIGSVTITANVPGSTITVDDVVVGKTPLAQPILVNPGRRRIQATHANRLPATKVIEVAGADTATVKLELAEGRTVVVVEKQQRRVPWLGWGITAALAVGAGFAGFEALKTSSSLSDARGKVGADPDDLNSQHKTVKTWSAIADIATAGAIVAGGVSLYLTIKWGKDASRPADEKRPDPVGAPKQAENMLGVGFTPGGMALSGTF